MEGTSTEPNLPMASPSTDTTLSILSEPSSIVSDEITATASLGFLDLPSELREKIYCYVFDITNVVYEFPFKERYDGFPQAPFFFMREYHPEPVASENANALLATCKQVHNEAVVVYYARATFVLFRLYDHYHPALMRLQSVFSNVRKLEIHTYTLQVRKRLPRLPNLQELTLRRCYIYNGGICLDWEEHRPHRDCVTNAFDAVGIMTSLINTDDDPFGRRIWAFRERFPPGVLVVMKFWYVKVFWCDRCMSLEKDCVGWGENDRVYYASEVTYDLTTDEMTWTAPQSTDLL